jgi:hypothetical protein
MRLTGRLCCPLSLSHLPRELFFLPQLAKRLSSAAKSTLADKEKQYVDKTRQAEGFCVLCPDAVTPLPPVWRGFARFQTTQPWKSSGPTARSMTVSSLA